MFRHVLPAIGLSTLLLASELAALELGNLHVLSVDGEPFKADIELSDVGQLTPVDIAVALASETEYQQAKIQRLPFLNQLAYDIILNGRDGGVIHVTGPAVTKVDNWHILLEARWPNGRRLKSYLVNAELQSTSESVQRSSVPDQAVSYGADEGGELVYEESHLPTVADEYLEPIAATPEPKEEILAVEESDLTFESGDTWGEESMSGSSYEPADVVEENQATPIQDIPIQNVYEPDFDQEDETYTTVRGDALWNIAHRVRPSDAVNIYQTLLALQQLNPDAFENNNVNQLKVGQVLRIPTETSVRANSKTEALREVREQIRRWEENNGSVRQLDARSETSSVATTSDDNRAPTLSLSTSGGVSTQNSDSSDGTVEDISRRLESVLSELNSAQRNNAILEDELENKDATIADLQNRLAVLNEQLASLQAKDSAIDDSGWEESPDATEELPADSTYLDQEPSADVMSNEEESLTFEDAVDPDTEFEELNNDLNNEQSTPELSKPEPSLLEKYGIWRALAVVGGLLAMIGLFLLARGRRNNEDEYIEEDFDLPEERQVPPPAIDASFSASSASTGAEEFLQPSVEADIEHSIEPEATLTDSKVSNSDIENDIDDPIKEADIYLAYGRNEQAANLLGQAIEQDPNNTALLHKLVEVHMASGNEQEALATRQKLLSLQGISAAPTEVEGDFDTLDAQSDVNLDEPFIQRIPEQGAASAASNVGTLDDLDLELDLDDLSLAEDAAGEQDSVIASKDESENYEMSLRSAKLLIAEGRPAAASDMIKSMMTNGTALQKQQAKELLLELGQKG